MILLLLMTIMWCQLSTITMSMSMRMTLFILMAKPLMKSIAMMTKYNENHLVDTDGLVLVGEVTGEQVQGGGGGVNLHCALETILVGNS